MKQLPPVYRYGYGQTVVHILPPGPRGEGPNPWSLSTPLCPSRRVLYRAVGVYTESLARTSRVCKRCQDEWRKATGAPAPKKSTAPSVRDAQRSRVYSAESLGLEPGRSFATEAQALAYAKALMASPWFVLHFGTFTVRWVRFTNGFGAYAYTGRALITLGVGHRNERSLLHEIAHHIVHRSYTSQIQGHGPLFARVNLALVQHKLGVEQAKDLLACYKVKRVKVASPALLERRGARPTGWQKLIHEGRVPA